MSKTATAKVKKRLSVVPSTHSSNAVFPDDCKSRKNKLRYARDQIIFYYASHGAYGVETALDVARWLAVVYHELIKEHGEWIRFIKHDVKIIKIVSAHKARDGREGSPLLV